MAVLWFLEGERRAQDHLVTMNKHFAVRCFQSLADFTALAKSDPMMMADAAVVHAPGFKTPLKEIHGYLQSRFPELLIFYLASGEDVYQLYSPGMFLLSLKLPAEELIMQIQSIIGIHSQRLDKKIKYRDIAFNPQDRVLKILPDHQVELTVKEADLLRYFLRQVNTCTPRQEIAEAVWPRLKVSARSIDSQVCRLRKKLTLSEVSIESEYGRGYLLR